MHQSLDSVPSATWTSCVAHVKHLGEEGRREGQAHLLLPHMFEVSLGYMRIREDAHSNSKRSLGAPMALPVSNPRIHLKYPQRSGFCHRQLF